MKKFVKVLLVLLAIIMLAAGCTGPSKQKDPGLDDTNLEYGQQSATSSSTPTPKPSGQTQTQDNPKDPDYTPPEQELVGLSVQQTVEGSSLNRLNTGFQVDESAIDVLRRDHQIETKDYGSGLGEMVLAIDGIKPDNKHFWAFYVNGKSSNVGASSYILKAGDRIEWRIEEIK